MSKVLVIPGSFVPYNDTVTLLSYKQLRLLDNEYDVIALEGKEDIELSKLLLNDENFVKFNVEYICNYNDVVMNIDNKNVLKGFFNMCKYIRKCTKQSKKSEYEYVYTASIPCFTHLAGYFIKKNKPDIKWIASFSDPIYKSPYKKDVETFKDYSLINKIGFFVYIGIYMNSIFEKLAMKYADEIIMISKQQLDFMCNNYKIDYHKKCHVVPLNYIKEWDIYAELCQKNYSRKSKKLIAVHMGRLYGLRKIDNFLLALSEFNEEFENVIEIHQFGEIQPRYLKSIKNLKLENTFIIHEKVDYKTSISNILSSDILLLFDTIIDGDNQPYLPSKITEYMLTNKPIIGVCQENSPSYQILKNNNYVGYSVNEIKNNLIELFTNYKLVDNRSFVTTNEEIKQIMENIL